MSDAFLSVVALRGQSGMRLVRARVAGDIQRVFPNAVVEETPDADYRFRAAIPCADVAATLASRLADIDYKNFKDSVRETDRHDAYMQVWSRMLALQQGRSKQPASAPSIAQKPVDQPVKTAPRFKVGDRVTFEDWPEEGTGKVVAVDHVEPSDTTLGPGYEIEFKNTFAHVDYVDQERLHLKVRTKGVNR
jgi:hypothetical protein